MSDFKIGDYVRSKLPGQKKFILAEIRYGDDGTDYFSDGDHQPWHRPDDMELIASANDLMALADTFGRLDFGLGDRVRERSNPNSRFVVSQIQLLGGAMRYSGRNVPIYFRAEDLELIPPIAVGDLVEVLPNVSDVLKSHIGLRFVVAEVAEHGITAPGLPGFHPESVRKVEP